MARRRVPPARRRNFETYVPINDTPISDADIATLPESVARYLKRTGVVGKRPVQTVRLRQRGLFKMSQTGKWATMVAEQRYMVQPPEFVWHATITPFPLAPVKVRDGFTDGRGWLEAKLFGLFPVARSRGPETDQGELLRFMSEIVWFPTAWLRNYITWESVDERSASATIDYEGLTASAVVSFDEQDRIAAIEAQRYRIVGNQYSLDTWAALMTEYKNLQGFEIPTSAQAMWKLAAGDFVYFRGEISAIEYDS